MARLTTKCVGAAMCASAALAGNPLVPNVGMADPHIHVFGGQFWLYSTHDFAPNNTNFLMKDWRVWSSPDLVSWTLVNTLDPRNTSASPSEYDECWATDGAEKDGAYFFYLSQGPTEIGVVKSISGGPGGPWKDMLGKPLINASVGPGLNPSTESRDPCVFQDRDGSYYLVFGTFNYYIAKLGNDMMSLAEPLRYVQINAPMGPYGNKTDDKPFLHRMGDVYYLSWGCFYATAASPYGPFTYRGVFVNTSFIAPDFRMNSTADPWYTNEDLADRHGSFFTHGGQWYFAANDRSHSSDKAYPHYYRDTVVGYVHINRDGTLAPVVIDATGVGQYDGQRAVEAENFFEMKGAAKGQDASGRFVVQDITAASSLRYPHVRNIPSATGNATLMITAANGGANAAFVRATFTKPGSSSSPASADILATCVAEVQPTGAWDEYATVPCRWRGAAAAAADGKALRGAAAATGPSEADIVLAFAAARGKDVSQELVRIDALHFASA